MTVSGHGQTWLETWIDTSEPGASTLNFTSGFDEDLVFRLVDARIGEHADKICVGTAQRQTAAMGMRGPRP